MNTCDTTDKVEFTVKLLCTMEFRHGAEQWMDSPEEIEEYLNSIRKEIRSALTEWGGYGHGSVMYLPKESTGTHATPTILDCIELDAETGIFTEIPFKS